MQILLPTAYLFIFLTVINNWDRPPDAPGSLSLSLFLSLYLTKKKHLLIKCQLKIKKYSSDLSTSRCILSIEFNFV